jgi:dolichol kinase
MPIDDADSAGRTSRSALLAPKEPRVSLSRSPHPYHLRGESIYEDGETPLQQKKASDASISRSDSTESGTEADDERGPILRGLPAPPARNRKGLIGLTPRGLTPDPTPLPSPPATLEGTIRETFDYFGAKPEWTSTEKEASPERKDREAYIRRKKGQIIRRATETLLLGFLAALSYIRASERPDITAWNGELLAYMLIPPMIYASYPIRKVWLARRYRNGVGEALATGLHLPSRFDPGPLLYPVVLPLIVSLSIAEMPGAVIPVNIVCGISSVPSIVTQIWDAPVLAHHLRWVAAVLPIHAATMKAFRYAQFVPFYLKIGASTVTKEDLALIPLMHDALKSVLYSITTSSLDPAELELLATGMVNLLLLSQSPQAKLLTGLLWVGGLSICITCGQLLSWEVELARIPKWKFAKRRDDTISQRILKAWSALQNKPTPAADSSDDDIDDRSRIKPLSRVKTVGNPRTTLREAKSALLGTPNGSTLTSRLPRRSTISDLDPKTRLEAERKGHHSSLVRSSFMSLTAKEAKLRKYLYAGAVYILVTLIALVPVRSYVSKRALSGLEPFGWAIGYLFADVPAFRDQTYALGLESWIPIPQQQADGEPSRFLAYLGYLSFPLSQGNVRLLLIAYCLTVLLLGITLVLSLSSYIEVDTRRKGFHGVMVAMLLPTIFIDPCFLSLALSLILAVFLLLDLFRASQLPPVSRPLTNFLAPYVDGRDHRGPVIVSHIFLLVGCAIPLWLSLAGLERTGDFPWKDWGVPSRNLSMVSGVICVGMGDAAASLIGRRFGRTKWYWDKNKSLEGSAAFTVAVTVGLMFGYTWLRGLGWRSWEDSDVWTALAKCVLAGSGASLLESVLTSANDNVVVPMGLWILVRGLDI